MDLQIAAQKHAAENIAVTEPLALTKNKVAAFDALGIAAENFETFSTMVEQARTQYLGGLTVPIIAAKSAE
jgi:hypothetical protein